MDLIWFLSCNKTWHRSSTAPSSLISGQAKLPLLESDRKFTATGHTFSSLPLNCTQRSLSLTELCFIVKQTKQECFYHFYVTVG